MRRLHLILALLGVLLGSETLLAQGGDRGAGNVNMGRGRTTWLTDAELATEALKQFEANLDAMPLAEWKESSVAWLAIEFDGDARRISLPETYHVDDVAADKRAEVERGGAEWEPSFRIAFPKKAPRELQVTMTDINATKVTCPLGEAVKSEKGLLGIFVHESALHCVFREARADDADAPA